MIQLTQPKGMVSKETNKEAIARVFGLKKRQVGYLSTSTAVDSYTILYDEDTQTSWYRGSATGTPTSWSISGEILTLVTSSGTFSLNQASADTKLREDLSSLEVNYGGDLVGAKKGRAPALMTRKVSDLLLDGTAGLRKNFGAVGDGITDDTAAFNDWWSCLMDVSYKRNAAQSDESNISFMLQKGPLLNIENGTFIYNGPGLNITSTDSFIFNVVGESPLSTKILLADNTYLFDFDNNPVHSYLANMTIHGGLGAVRFKSTSRTTAGIHLFEKLRLSRFTECGISNNSIDMPYFRIRDSIIYGDTSSQPIGICVSGLSAGGFIKDCLISDVRYGIKLAVGSNGTVNNGPATPFTISDNDFYRTGNRGGSASYDVWLVPGTTTNNSGRAISFSGNKFGQENLITPDCHILIADAATSGSGLSLNGDRAHVDTQSSGYISGLMFNHNNVNSSNAGYIAPFIRSNTPNVGNNKFADLYDNDMPSRIIEFSAGITQSQVTNLTRSNVFDASLCMALQEGGEPQLLSNLDGVFSLIDPLHYYSGHPQGGEYPIGNQKLDFTSIYNSPAGNFTIADATRTLLNNSYGGLNEANEVNMTLSTGRLFTTMSGLLSGRKTWLDFELKRGSTNSVRSVKVEITDSTGTIIWLRRIILLDSVSRWQKVILPFIPSVSGSCIVRFSAAASYVSGSATNFIVGNINMYLNDCAISTGHNSNLASSWNRQHTLFGSYHEWYDASGNKRSKASSPTSDTDGVIISANPST